MKISAIFAGVIGAIAVMALDSMSIWPIVIACICFGYLVFVICVKWDELMRYWVSKGYWSYDSDDLGEITDLWEYKRDYDKKK